MGVKLGLPLEARPSLASTAAVTSPANNPWTVPEGILGNSCPSGRSELGCGCGCGNGSGLEDGGRGRSMGLLRSATTPRLYVHLPPFLRQLLHAGANPKMSVSEAQPDCSASACCTCTAHTWANAITFYLPGATVFAGDADFQPPRLQRARHLYLMAWHRDTSFLWHPKLLIPECHTSHRRTEWQARRNPKSSCSEPMMCGSA